MAAETEIGLRLVCASFVGLEAPKLSASCIHLPIFCRTPSSHISLCATYRTSNAEDGEGEERRQRCSVGHVPMKNAVLAIRNHQANFMGAARERTRLNVPEG